MKSTEIRKAAKRFDGIYGQILAAKHEHRIDLSTDQVRILDAAQSLVSTVVERLHIDADTAEIEGR